MMDYFIHPYIVDFFFNHPFLSFFGSIWIIFSFMVADRINSKGE
jgi:hypothetical protein